MLNLNKKVTAIISIKSFSINILKYYIAAFYSLNKLKHISLIYQPTKYKTLTVLKSPHKYKKAQEHYQLRIYKGVLTILDVNINKIYLLLSNKPQGVSINIKLKHK